MKTPHKHHDLIVAWAAGAEIEVQEPLDLIWHTTPSPQWDISRAYRIKPEPKPDVVYFQQVSLCADESTMVTGLSKHICEFCNMRYTFHGETGKLIKAEVI